MNKKAAFYKYAKLYSWLIKYADFTPLPNSGILQIEEYLKNTGKSPEYIYKNMDLSNIYQKMYEQQLGQALRPVTAKTSITDRLFETSRIHRNIQSDKSSVQAAHNMRNILMSTYTPEQQQIIKQTQIIPTRYVQGLVGNYHVPMINAVAVAPDFDATSAHEFEHVVDATRRRKVPSARFSKKYFDARDKLNSGAISNLANTDGVNYVYRTEQIANTVPQIRLKRLWGTKLNNDQRRILSAIEQAAIISDNNYKGATQHGAIDPFITAKFKNIPSINRELTRQAKRQGVYSIAPELYAYGFNSSGEKDTVWNRYLAEAQQAKIDQKIIDANRRKLSTMKAIQRHNRLHPNNYISGLEAMSVLAKIK